MFCLVIVDWTGALKKELSSFVKLREILSTHKELAYKLRELEQKIEKHDAKIQAIFDAIRQLMEPPPEKSKPRIGFHVK